MKVFCLILGCTFLVIEMIIFALGLYLNAHPGFPEGRDKKKIKNKETRFKGLIFIWHNPENLIDYYLDPNTSTIYGFYKGILLPKYKLEHIDI